MGVAYRVLMAGGIESISAVLNMLAKNQELHSLGHQKFSNLLNDWRINPSDLSHRRNNCLIGSL